MIRIKIFLIYTIAGFLLVSCKSKQSQTQTDTSMVDTTNILNVKYAEGYKLSRKDGYLLLEIRDPQESSNVQYQFALKNKGSQVKIPEKLPVIELPIEKVICMTSLQLSNFIKMNETERVVGITSTRYLFNEKVREQLENGSTHKIGIEGNFDNEIIISLEPDLILISPFKRGGYDAVRDINIPLVPHLGYKEITPLGQAEWVKLIALLIGEQEKGIDIFNGIEKEYNVLKSRMDSVVYRPTVFSGEMRGGVWYAVGGKSFLSTLFRDAGADYFLKNDNRSGGVNLDFESIYELAENAEFWRIANSYAGKYNYDIIKAQDERYSDFKAFKDKGIIYCNMRDKPFYENMPMEPEKVLADMINIFHPEVLPYHIPVYYDLLK